MGSCFSASKCPCLWKCIFYPPYSTILDNLYVGNYSAGENIVKDKVKITNVLSLIPIPDELKEKYNKEGIQYEEYRFGDIENENVVDRFNEKKDDIHKILFEEKGTLLINCSAGASRSVSFIILTLMTYYNYCFHDAYDLVNKKRLVKMNDSFYDQVKKYKPSK